MHFHTEHIVFYNGIVLSPLKHMEQWHMLISKYNIIYRNEWCKVHIELISILFLYFFMVLWRELQTKSYRCCFYCLMKYNAHGLDTHQDNIWTYKFLKLLISNVNSYDIYRQIKDRVWVFYIWRPVKVNVMSLIINHGWSLLHYWPELKAFTSLMERLST